MRSDTCRFDTIPKPRKGRVSRTNAATASPASIASPPSPGENTADMRTRPAGQLRDRATGSFSSKTNNSGRHSLLTPPPPSLLNPGSNVLPPTQPAKEWISSIVGSSSDHDPYVLRHVSFNDLNYYRRPDWACVRVGGSVNGGTHFTLVPDSHLDARPRYYPQEDVRALLKDEKEQLLQAYFETVHQSLPLLTPAVFEREETGNVADDVTDNVNSDKGIDNYKVGDLLLATVCEIASPFYMHKQSPNDMKVLDWIFQALPCEKRQPKLETIEASLVFLHRHARYHRAPPTPGLWSEIGSIVGMAHDVGLNVDPSIWDISAENRDRRIRLWWMIFMHDKWSALALGRPSYLHDDNCNVPLPTTDNFPATNYRGLPTPHAGILQFVGMAALSTIVSDILATFYSLRSPERLRASISSTTEHPAQLLAGPFWDRLDAFHNEHLVPLYEVDGFLDPTGTIFLAYYTAQITVYRALMRYLDPAGIPYQALRRDVRVVIDNVITLLERLTVRRLRAFWWSQISNHNFALAGGFMMSLLLTSVDDAEVDYWTARIKLYHDLLQNHSVSFVTTRMATARMSLLLTSSPGQDERETISNITNTSNTAGAQSTAVDFANRAFHGDFWVDPSDK